MKVEIESAIHQSSLGTCAQSAFLFRAQKKIINLIRKRILLILFEEPLKGSLDMLFISRVEFPGCAEGVNQGCFANPAWTNDADQFLHNSS